jgi:hypothetical protein
MSERRRVTQLAGRNPSFVSVHSQPVLEALFSHSRRSVTGHRINVDADMLGKQTREGLQASAFPITFAKPLRSGDPLTIPRGGPIA